MLDSLAVGLPCIAFDCPTGPSQIIKSGYNGVLVNNGNVAELGLAILAILYEDNLSDYSSRAIDSSEPYRLETIVDTWAEMMNL